MTEAVAGDRAAPGGPGAQGDRIELGGLRVVAVVGVLPEERDRPQPLELDLVLWVDLGSAGESDSLADTVDYSAVCETTVAAVRASGAQLLERLAAEVAAVVLAVDDRITATEVSVAKMRPPVPHDLDRCGVRIVRRAPRTQP